MKNLSYLILTMFVVFSTGCNDDDNSSPQDNLSCLPKVIKTEQSYNAEPNYDYTHTQTFQYDENYHPVKIVYESHRKLKNSSSEVLTYSMETELVYGDIIYRTDVIKQLASNYDESQGYVTTTNVRQYKLSSEILVEIILNGEYSESMELTNYLLTKFNGITITGIPDDEPLLYTKEYKYNNNNNIIEYTYKTGDSSSSMKYTYDGRKGIYRDMNIPQWLFIALFGEEGQFNNISNIQVLSDDSFIPYGVNKYVYNSQGYPIEIVFSLESNWNGVWGNKTTIEYEEVDLSLVLH